MGFNLEPKVIILRAGKEFFKFGDPFEFVATITIENGIAHVQAALGQLPSYDLQSFFDSLRDMGVTKIVWERFKGMKTKILEFDLTQKSG